MGRFRRHVTGNLYTTLIFLAGLAVVVYILVAFRIWSMSWTDYFIRTWKIEELIFVFLIVSAVTIVLTSLFNWFIRKQVGRR